MAMGKMRSLAFTAIGGMGLASAVSAQPFSGDVRVRARRLHPLGEGEYLFTRTRVRYGDHLMAGGMVRRPTTVKAALHWAPPEHALNVVLGDYSLGYGQGLVFYDKRDGFARSAKFKGRGGAPDLSGSSNNSLRGAVFEKERGTWRGSFFVSRRERGADIHEENELLWGGRAQKAFGGLATIGATAYRSRCGAMLSPAEAAGYGADFDSFYGNVNLFGEAAVSYSKEAGGAPTRGKAWTFTPLVRQGRTAQWIALFSCDASYFTGHGRNITPQRGAIAGFEQKGRRLKHRVNYGLARPFSRKIYWESVLSLPLEWEFLFRGQRESNERRPAAGAQISVRADRCRWQAAWEPVASVRLIGRYETRKERAAGEASAFGDYVMADARWKGAGPLTVSVRVYFYKSPRVSLTSGSEELWGGISGDRPGGGMGNFRGEPGERRYLLVGYDPTPRLSFWVKLDEDIREDGTGLKQGVHAQADYRWGEGTK